MSSPLSIFKTRSQYLSWAIFSLLMTLGIQSAHAQPPLKLGAGDPTEAIKGMWYMDTVAHRVWVHNLSAWYSTRKGYCVRHVICDGLMAFYNGDEWHLYQTITGKYMGFADDVTCMDKLAVAAWPSINRFFVDTTYTAWNWVKDNSVYPARLTQPDTLMGMAAYCATSFTAAFRTSILGSESHAWGMLGINGQWIIEPKYDKPFRFKKGKAEVLLYGKPMKINEKGEEVK
jgi:hypothetical protein